MTKEKLQQYQALRRERAQIEAELAKIDADMTAPRLSKLTGMPRSGGGSNPLEDLVAKKMGLYKLYYAKLQELVKAQMEVEQAIETLDPTERRLLRYRYIDGLKWEEVCVSMGYSWRQVHRTHSAALRRLREQEEAET